MSAYAFKPWEIPTGGTRTPESVTEPVDRKVLLQAKLTGIAEYRSPLDPEVDLEDPQRRWWLHERELPNGHVLYLEPMLPGHLSLCLVFDKWNLERWCFHDHDAGWRAVLGWNGKGDPDGWYRHPATGRRRPDGTPESEFINKGDM